MKNFSVRFETKGSRRVKGSLMLPAKSQAQAREKAVEAVAAQFNVEPDDVAIVSMSKGC